MRYKIAGLILVLLIATPVYSQEKSYIVVETPNTTEPTVVKTGEVFTQEYIVRFIDLTELGEEVVIQEDGLNSGVLGSFDVLGFHINKGTDNTKEYLEHIWHLTYTLRLVSSKKGTYKIPAITIPWVLKQIGQDVADPSLKVNTDFKTQEVFVSYVTTITADPYLDIRDGFNFGSFNRTAWIYRGASWLFVLIPFMWLAVLARRQYASDPAQQHEMVKIDTNADTAIEPVNATSGKKALRNLRRSVKKLENFGESRNGNDVLREVREVTSSAMIFLRAEVPESNPGTTPSDMVILLSADSYKKSYRSRVLLKLALDIKIYQSMLERGFISPEFWLTNPSDADVRNLRMTLNNLRLSAMLKDRLFYYLSFGKKTGD